MEYIGTFKKKHEEEKKTDKNEMLFSRDVDQAQTEYIKNSSN